MSKENLRVMILSEGKLYGPFVEKKGTSASERQTAQDIAQAWLDQGHLSTQQFEMYSVWDAELATPEKAHECGIRLQPIEEADTSSRTSRRAASA